MLITVLFITISFIYGSMRASIEDSTMVSVEDKLFAVSEIKGNSIIIIIHIYTYHDHGHGNLREQR